MKNRLKGLLEHRKTIALILGIGSVLALPPFYVFPILLLTFSSLILMIDKVKNHKASFALGYWFGFGFFSVGLSWVGNALLIDAATFGWLYIISFLAGGAFFGFFIAFPALLASYNKNITAKVLSFSAYMVIFEWIRSFIFTGFPWNLWGSTLAFYDETIQLASIIGTYGLSLLVIMFSGSIAILIKGNKKTAVLMPAIICAVVILFGVSRVKILNNDELSETKIRIVQPAIPQEMKWDRETLEANFNKHIEMSQEPGLEDIDFTIWGETASPFTLDMNERYLARAAYAVPPKGYLITGLVRFETNHLGEYQPLNSMFIIDEHGTIMDFYDKSHLVPFGEYIPARHLLPKWVRPITNTIANFKPGNGFKTFNIAGHPAFSALICYEIIFPSEVVDTKDRPEWVINLTNDGWYGDSPGPYQHLVATQLRAIEEGITIVRVANSGISALVSRTGHIIDKIPLNVTGNLDIFLPQELSTKTLYGTFGNLIPLILCIANILISFLISKKHN